MGNNTTTHSPKEKLYHSFEELSNSVKPLDLDNKEKPIMKHRFSEPKRFENGLRHQYFHKLHQENKREKEERMSLRHRESMRNFHTLSGKEDLDNSFANQSFMEKQSMEDSMIDLKSSLSRNSTKTISQANSPYASRKNSGSEKCENENNRHFSGRYTININTKSHRRSLSHKPGELSSYSNTRNTLFLNKEEEVEMDLESANNNGNLDLRNRRKNNLSSDNISLNTNNFPFDARENSSNYLDSALKNDDISEFSSNLSRINRYNTRQSAAYNDYELNYVKNGENLRRSYIAKLIYKKVWQPSKKEKNHNTLIIFDWDDTLLCTSFLTPNGIFNEDLELSDKEKEKIAKLEFSSLRLLTAAIEKGDTYIITNAAPGWVEYSAERFYPSVRKILNKVQIISARGEYEAQYPGDSRMWKIQSFLNMQKNFDNNLVTNIICLGDSFIEMEAAHVLASKFSQAFIKTIKFRESPKPEELNKQLSLVADQFPVIYSTIKNLTIRVEKKAKR